MDLQLSTGALPSGVTQLGLAGRYVDFGTDPRYDDEEIPEDPTMGMSSYVATLMLRHYFGKGWSADLSVPTGTIRIDTYNYTTEETDKAYVSGFGDLKLSGRYDFAGIWGVEGYKPSLALTLGLGLPTGTQVVLENTNVGFLSNLLALGYGAFSGNARLEFTQSLHRLLALKLSGQVSKPLSWSEQGVMYGLAVNYGLGLLYRTTSWLTITAQAVGQHLEPNKMIADESENPNSGSDLFAAQLDLSFRITPSLYTGINGRVPFLTLPNGRQLIEKFTASAYLALVFGVEEPEEKKD